MSDDDCFAQFPKEYRKAVSKFCNLWTKNQNNARKKNSLLQTFSEKYTMVPHWWKIWIDLIRWSLFEDEESRFFTKTAKEIEIESLKHFPGQLTDEWPSFDKTIFSDYKKSLEEKLEYAEFLLSFPHSKLSLTLATFNELSTKSTTKPKNMQLYYKNLVIFKEMHGTNIKDGEKYIEILQKTKNNEFVIKNIECQLSKNPWCQNLWIAYIHFLENDKERDYEALLSVLKRYCRFFINDKKMKEKYQTKIEEFSPNLNGISEFWIDSIKFELQFNGKNAAMKIVEKALESKMKDISKFLANVMDFVRKFRLPNIEQKIISLKDQYPLQVSDINEYDFESVVKKLIFNDRTKMQKFPFSKSVNQYLYDTIDYEHLRKLYQTCKWFYYKYRLNLVHKLEIQKRSYTTELTDFSCNIPYFEYLVNSIMFSPCKIESVNLKNLWLTNALNIIDCQKMSALLPKISKCSLKYLHISSSNITKNEFEILTKSKTIVVLRCQKIKDEKDENMVIEEILKNVPNVRQIRIVPAYLTLKSAEALLSLKFNNKFDFVDLDFKPQINAGLYFEFLEKNLQPKSTVHAYFPNGETEYENAMKQYFSQWHPKNETPTLSFCVQLGEVFIG